MPQIPTYETRGSLLGRVPGLSTASPAAFGAQTGEAIQDLGQQGLRNTNTVNAIVQEKKNLEDDKWTNDAMSELRKYYGPWMADPENNTKETFADDLQKQTDQSLKDWEAKAPTKQAREKFRAQFQNFADSRHTAAAITAAGTKLDNMLLSHKNLNGTIISGYDVDRNTPNLNANTELMANMEQRFVSIDSALGKIAPAKAQQLKGELIEDAAYATMNYSPSTARKILDKGKGLLDGRRIHAIESQIKTAEEASKMADRSALTALTKNLLAVAEARGNGGYLDAKTVSLYLPDDKVDAYVTEVNAQIKAYNTVHEHVNKVSSWNPAAKAEYLEELEKGVGANLDTANEDAFVHYHTRAKLQKQMEFQIKDPAGALIEYNPAAKGLHKQIEQLKQADIDMGVEKPNPMIKQKQGELTSLLVALQSQPPKDYTAEQKKQHTIANRSDLAVMSKSQAEGAVQAINQSSPEEAVNTIRSVVSNHPGYEDIAFNNLVENGLDLAYWALYKNQQNQNVADLSGALKAMKELKETNPQRLSDINKALDPGVTPKWDAFLQLFPNDHFQRQDITAGMHRAVVAYAVTLMQDKNISAELAVQKSVDTWIFDEMAMAYPNGRPVLLDRRQGEGKMTDAEVDAFGRNLGELQKRVNPREIDDLKWHFPTIWGPNGLGTEEEKWNQTQGLIASRGYFKPAGEYSTLYMRSDSGRDFELRRNGKAIAVKNSDVEQFVAAITFTHPETGITYTQNVNNPPEVKPIFEKGKKVVPTTGTSAQDKGFRGMANLMNPASPHNIINRIYGGQGLGVGKDLYWKQTAVETISTNWPVEPKYFQDRP